MRLSGQPELIEVGFNVKPLALSFQGMVFPLCVGLWIIEFIDVTTCDDV